MTTYEWTARRGELSVRRVMEGVSRASVTLMLLKRDCQSEADARQLAISRARELGLREGAPQVALRDAYRPDSGTHIDYAIEATVWVEEP